MGQAVPDTFGVLEESIIELEAQHLAARFHLFREGEAQQLTLSRNESAEGETRCSVGRENGTTKSQSRSIKMSRFASLRAERRRSTGRTACMQLARAARILLLQPATLSSEPAIVFRRHYAASTPAPPHRGRCRRLPENDSSCYLRDGRTPATATPVSRRSTTADPPRRTAGLARRNVRHHQRSR